MRLKKFLIAVITFVFVLFTLSNFKTLAVDKTANYTVTSTSAVSEDNAPDGTSASYSSTYSSKCQLTKGNSMTLSLSGYDAITIKGLTLSMKSNTSAGAGTLLVSAGSNTLASISDCRFNDDAWYGSYSTDYVDVVIDDFKAYTVEAGEEIVITISATANSLYCQSFKLDYETSAVEAFKDLNTKASLKVNYEREAVTIDSYTYSLVNDINSLADGDNIIIVAADYDVALSTIQNSNNRGVTAITKNESIIEFNARSNVQILTLISSDDNFKLYTGTGYLYAASSSNNHLKTTTDTDNANSIFSISFSDTGVATIKAQGDSTHNVLRYNSSNNLFACYLETSVQKDIVIYKESAVSTTTVNDYTFDSVQIRFGGIISSSIYNELVLESATFGIELSTASDFTDSKTYTMNPILNVDSYQWAAVIPTASSHYDDVIYARAYVIVNGITYNMNSTSYSIKTIANYYINNAINLELTDETVEMLSALMEG